MRTTWGANAVLAAALGRIEARIRTQLSDKDPSVRPLLSQVSTKGKRLRARLTVLTAQTCGQRGAKIERLALGMELLHLATLVHDDIIDEAAQRRHRTTVNERFGAKAAVLAGDLILTRAMHMLVADMPPSMAQLLARAAAAVCVGEIQEFHDCGRLDLTERRYLAMIGNKTASLLSACCEGGAVLAGASRELIGVARRFGRDFGLAFQVQDDLLDWTGRPAQVGKPVGHDLRQGRITLPVIFGWKRLRGAERRMLANAAHGQDVDIRRVSAALERCGALEATRKLGRGFAEKALRTLQGLPAGTARDELAELTQSSIERQA